MPELRHRADAQTFVAEQDGVQLAYLEYELADQVATITHTVTQPQAQGQGLAGKLTAYALDTAREQGWKIVPECSYARSFIERHSEYADLLA